MRKKVSCSFCKVFGGLVLVVTGLFLWFFPPKQRESLSAKEQDYSSFTGLVFFVKTKDCDETCIAFNKVVIKIYEKFPNNVGVIDCTDPSAVSATLTKYKVDSTKIPKILSFKNGVDNPYNSFTDYESLENYLLSIMRTVKPPKQVDRTVANLEEAS